MQPIYLRIDDEDEGKITRGCCSPERTAKIPSKEHLLFAELGNKYKYVLHSIEQQFVAVLYQSLLFRCRCCILPAKNGTVLAIVV